MVGVLTVMSGLAIWKPVQFSELASLFGNFQTARLVHFLCMTAIVLFFVVHVALALLVPRTLVAMLTGGPTSDDDAAAAARTETLQNRTERAMTNHPQPRRDRSFDRNRRSPGRC